MSVTRETLIDFIYDEVRMLDEGRYTEWLNLWLRKPFLSLARSWQQVDVAEGRVAVDDIDPFVSDPKCAIDQ